MKNTSPLYQTFQVLLTEHEVAPLLRVSVASLRRWRLSRQGPKFLKLGACVRYRPQDISAYLESLAGEEDLMVVNR